MSPTVLQRILVVVSAVAYLGIGAWCLIDPLRPLADVGVTVLDDRGVIELRAMYGGLEFGMGLFLLWCARYHVVAGLMGATMTLGGLGVMRMVGWMTLQPEGSLHPALFCVELVGTGLGVFALVRGPRS